MGLCPQKQHSKSRNTLLQLRVLIAAAAVALLCRPVCAWADVSLDLGPGVYNPSLVVYQGSAWVVARSTKLQWDTTGLKWIMNCAHLCEVNTTNWSTISCHAFDPYQGRYGVQCRWGSDTWRVPWEAWGVDDTKLFLWPGRGLWAMTGRRPQRSSNSKYCPQVIWRQWLLHLADEGAPPNPQEFSFPPEETIHNVTFVARDGSTTGAAAAAVGVQQVRRKVQQHLPAQLGFENRLGARRRLFRSGINDGVGSLSGVDDQEPQQQPQHFGRPRRRRRRCRLRKHRRPLPGTQKADTATPGNNGGDIPLLPLLPSAPSETALQDTSAADSSSSTSWDALRASQPVPLHIKDAAAVYGTKYAIVEKNWMPFVYEGQLFVTYSLAPKHRTYLLHPYGTAEPKYESDSGQAFSALGAAASKVHGGPPMIRVDPNTYGSTPGASSSSRPGYYLGVAHYWKQVKGSKDGRSYKHFFIKMEAEPPFKVLQVSREIPLKYNPHYKHVAFVSGLDIAMLPVGAAVANAVSAPPAAAGTAVRAVLHADVPHSLQPPQPHTTHGTSSSGPARLLLGQSTPSTSTELAASALPARGSTAATPAGAAAAPGPPAGTTAAAAAAVFPASDTAAVAAAASGPPAGATATTAAVLPAGSNSTGSLTEDANADAYEFSWHVEHRAPDVNTFSWVATAPNQSGRTRQHKQSSGSLGYESSTASAVASTPVPSSSSVGTGEKQQGLLPAIEEGNAVSLGAQTARSDGASKAGVLASAAKAPAAAPAVVRGAAAAAVPAAAGQAGQLMPHVLVSYGSGDWESRLAVLTLQEVDDLFEPMKA